MKLACFYSKNRQEKHKDSMFYDAFYNTSHAKTAVIVQEIFYFHKEQEQYRNNIMTDNSVIYFPQCHTATIVIEDKTAQGKQTKTS